VDERERERLSVALAERRTGNYLLLVDVDLDKLHVGELAGELLDVGRDGLARAAPDGVVVHDSLEPFRT